MASVLVSHSKSAATTTVLAESAGVEQLPDATTTATTKRPSGPFEEAWSLSNQ